MKKYLISEITCFLKTKKVRKLLKNERNYETIFAKVDSIIEKFYTGGSKDFFFIEKVTDEIYKFSPEKEEQSIFFSMMALGFSIITVWFSMLRKQEIGMGAIILLVLIGIAIIIYYGLFVLPREDEFNKFVQEYKIYKLLEVQVLKNRSSENLAGEKRLIQRSKIRHIPR